MVRWNEAVCALSVMVVLLFSGCTMPPPDGPDMPPSDKIVLQQGNTTQSDLLYWDTEFFVTDIQGDLDPFWAEVVVSLEDRDGQPSDPAAIECQDADADGNISVGDLILVRGMRDEHNGGSIELTVEGEVIGRLAIGWNRGNPLIYTVWLYGQYPPDENGTGWDLDFSFASFHSDIPVRVGQVRFVILDQQSDPLTVADVIYNDTDDDGLVSVWDRVELRGMTEEYHRSTIGMYDQETLIGLSEILIFGRSQ